MLCKSAYKTSQAGLTSARLNIPNMSYSVQDNAKQSGLTSACLNIKA